MKILKDNKVFRQASTICAIVCIASIAITSFVWIVLALNPWQENGR